MLSPHLSFLAALAKNKIPDKKISANPQCILMLSEKIKSEKKTKFLYYPRWIRVLPLTWAMTWKNKNCPKVAKIRLYVSKVARILSFSSRFLSPFPTLFLSQALALPFPREEISASGRKCKKYFQLPKTPRKRWLGRGNPFAVFVGPQL